MAIAGDVQFTHDIDPLDVANYFIRADHLRDQPDVTPMKLQKLLYLAQANYLASTGQRLFDADVKAYEHGPVVHSVWKRYRGKEVIADESNGASAAALPSDIESFLSEIWSRYKHWSPGALRQLTHDQAPWADNYVEAQHHTVIPDADMMSYFRTEVPATDRIFHPSVVVVTPDAFEDDEEADARLQAFLAS